MAQDETPSRSIPKSALWLAGIAFALAGLGTLAARPVPASDPERLTVVQPATNPQPAMTPQRKAD